jgi:hypothetical protein
MTIILSFSDSFTELCHDMMHYSGYNGIVGRQRQLYSLGMDSIENIISNSSSFVACIFVAVETCWLSRCLGTGVSAALLWSHYFGF